MKYKYQLTLLLALSSQQIFAANMPDVPVEAQYQINVKPLSVSDCGEMAEQLVQAYRAQYKNIHKGLRPAIEVYLKQLQLQQSDVLYAEEVIENLKKAFIFPTSDTPREPLKFQPEKLKIPSYLNTKEVQGFLSDFCKKGKINFDQEPYTTQVEHLIIKKLEQADKAKFIQSIKESTNGSVIHVSRVNVGPTIYTPNSLSFKDFLYGRDSLGFVMLEMANDPIHEPILVIDEDVFETNPRIELLKFFNATKGNYWQPYYSAHLPLPKFVIIIGNNS